MLVVQCYNVCFFPRYSESPWLHLCGGIPLYMHSRWWFKFFNWSESRVQPPPTPRKLYGLSHSREEVWSEPGLNTSSQVNQFACYSSRSCVLPSLKDNASHVVLNTVPQSLFSRHVASLYYENVCTSPWHVPAPLLEESQRDWQV